MSSRRTPTRSGRRRRPLTEAERAERRERDRKRLEDATRALQSSDGWRRWVAVRRHNGLARYSANNQFLLVCEAWARGIELSYVAGYRWWAEHGYQVRKGERALGVLAPLVRKVDDPENGKRVRRVVGFRGVAVFDRSQVDAGPDATPIEPPAAEPLCGDSHAALLPRLEAFAASIGVRVSYAEPMRSEGARGYYRHSERLVAIAPDEPNAMVRTLLHELAHALVAARRPEGERAVDGLVLDYAEEECVVECTGHIAASAIRLDTSGEAVSYVAGWGEGGKLAVVAEAARLIDSLASELEQAMGVGERSMEPEAVAS